MNKILLTGGAGMIGSNLISKLIILGYEVYVVDNLWRGKIENINNINNFDINNFKKLDLTNYKSCLDVTENIDIVLHFADVVAGINYVFKNEFSLYQENTLMNTNILRAAIKNKVKKFMYLGTACSYPEKIQDKLMKKGLKEDQVFPANPESSYGWSKLMGEYEILLASKHQLIETCILRLHNVYGYPCELDDNKSQVIPALCKKVIQNNELIVWGSGKQRRAFLYVDDVIDGILKALDKGFNKGAIQLGPESSISIGEIAKKIVKFKDRDVKIVYDKTKAEGDFDRFADISFAKKILNWEPNTKIDDGLLKTYNWIQSKIK